MLKKLFYFNFNINTSDKIFTARLTLIHRHLVSLSIRNSNKKEIAAL